jgi:DNA repair exonuclease SbcCD ATPase subunit
MRLLLLRVFPVGLFLIFAGCSQNKLEGDGTTSSSEMGSASSDSPRAKPEETTATSDKDTDAAQAMARRPADTGMSATELVAQLNDTSREVAALRVSNAKLKAERSRAAAPRVETVIHPEANDEKLTASFQTYSQFKKDLAGFLEETEKLRTENGTLSAQMAALSAQVREAQAQLEPLKAEALAQKDSRERAEQAAEKLREQLRAIARALSAAGLSLDAFSGDRDPTARLETSAARIRAAADAEKNR